MDFSKKANSADLLIQSLQKQWPSALPSTCTLEIGLSGGVDSVVLFDLLIKASKHIGFTLQAVHVHHGLSPHADAWAEHCQKLCDLNQVPLRIVRAIVAVKARGVEAAARQVRYDAFCQSNADAVVLAHHADDQAETLLLHVLRGGGVHALSAMRVWRLLTDTIGLWRPLLGITRAQLADYAHRQALHWVEDESNADLSYRRNWLRHVVLPAMASYLPDYRHHMACCIQEMADASAIVDEVLAMDRAQCIHKGRLELGALKNLSIPRQQQLLLYWVQDCELGMPTRASLKSYLHQLHTAKKDSMPTWQLPKGRAYRYRDELWSERFVSLNYGRTLIDSHQERLLPQWGGLLCWQAVEHGLSSELLSQGVWLDLPLPGAKLKKAVGHQSFKTLFQMAGVPPFLRRRWPVLLDAKGYCVALPSIGVASDKAVKNGWWPEWVITECHSPDLLE